MTDSKSGAIEIVLKTLGGMRMVDLAPKLERGIPRWPTHPHLTIDKAVTHDHDGYYCQAIMMAEHTGAHVDAPAHMLPNRMDRTIDTFPADHLFASAVLYDFSDRDLKPGDLITAATYAMTAGLTVDRLAHTWAPYLTMAEALKLTAQTFTTDVTKLSCCAG